MAYTGRFGQSEEYRREELIRNEELYKRLEV